MIGAGPSDTRIAGTAPSRRNIANTRTLFPQELGPLLRQMPSLFCPLLQKSRSWVSSGHHLAVATTPGSEDGESTILIYSWPVLAFPFLHDATVQLVPACSLGYRLPLRLFDKDATDLLVEPLLIVLSEGIHDLTISLPLCISFSHDLGPGRRLHTEVVEIPIEPLVIGLGDDFYSCPIL